MIKIRENNLINVRPKRPLMSHQKNCSDFLSRNYDQAYGGAVYMEMRLGKTLTLIRFLESKDEFHRGAILVLCPNSVKGTWGKELSSEGIHNSIILDGPKEKRKEQLGYDWHYVICNYESAQSLSLHMYSWKAVILDESIAISNPKTDISKYIMNKFLHITFKYVLCGKPAPENELQYFNQLCFVYHTFMGCTDYWSFRHKYFTENFYKWRIKAGAKKEMYQELHRKAFILTRSDAGKGNTKKYRIRSIPTTDLQRVHYNSMFKDFEANGILCKHAPVKFLYMHKIAGGHNLKDSFCSYNKIYDLMHLLDTELKGKQVIVWSRFINELQKIFDVLYKSGHRAKIIYGDTPADLREQFRQKFWAKEFDVSVMSLKAMKEGTDWSCAEAAIYYSNEPSFNIRAQSEDRIIHPMDTREKQIIDLCSKDTLDFDLLELLKGKKMRSGFFMSALYNRVLNRGAI